MLVRGLDAEVNVTEEVFGRPIHPMKCPVTGEDIVPNKTRNVKISS
jgi:hypothetical protein